MKPLLSLLVAVQFLTRIPVPLAFVTDKRTVGRSLLYYPFVGVMLGLVLAGLNIALTDTPAILRAALVLAAWVLLTGALHLDGLADSADAWIGGLGNRKRTLAIMKDPYCGPAAVVALVVVLLIKFSALHSLDSSNWLALVLVPMLARASIPLLFLTTPYVRAGGLGSALASELSRVGVVVVLAVTAGVTALTGTMGFWLLFVLAGTFILLRALMMLRIGGTTGDTAGALIETSETALLIVAVLAPR